MGRVRALIVIGSVLSLVALGCGDSDDSAGETESETVAEPTTAVDDDSASGEGAPAETSDTTTSSASGSGGTLVLGDETIALDSARCFLQEQDAAAGGGKILFVAQGFGTNAAGDPVVVDVSRYDEDSQFFGDDIKVDIGDPFSDEAVSLGAVGEVGTVVIDGSQLSANGLTFSNFDDATEVPGSFEIDC